MFNMCELFLSMYMEYLEIVLILIINTWTSVKRSFSYLRHEEKYQFHIISYSIKIHINIYWLIVQNVHWQKPGLEKADVV